MLKRVGFFVICLSLVAPAGFAADVALFNNDSYVDWLPTDGSSSEASNLYDTLLSQGHTVTTFDGITAADWATATAGKGVLAIPELEHGDLNASLDAAARAAIANYVQGGGVLWVFGSSDTEALDLLNAVFGYSLSSGDDDDPYPLNNSDAVGTPFEGGPVTLPYNNDTTGIASSSLPPGSRVVYEESLGPANSIVSLIPEGSGWIVFFGWDWYDAAPTGALDGGWLEVLNRGTELAGISSEPKNIPTLSGWSVLALVLMLATAGAILMTRRRFS